MQSKNFLSIDQVKELASVGVKFENSEFIYRVHAENTEDEAILSAERETLKYLDKNVPTYDRPSVGEILDELPSSINWNAFFLNCDNGSYSLGYRMFKGEELISLQGDSLLQLLFELLLFLANNCNIK